MHILVHSSSRFTRDNDRAGSRAIQFHDRCRIKQHFPRWQYFNFLCGHQFSLAQHYQSSKLAAIPVDSRHHGMAGIKTYIVRTVTT